MNNIVNNLNIFLSNLNVYYRKLQNYHWNIQGPDFFEVHAKLEEFYNKINTQIDEVAEHILIIGGEPLGSLKDYLDNTDITEAPNTKIKSREVFASVTNDLNLLLNQVINIKKEADKIVDYNTSILMDDFITDYSKTLWMLKHVVA